MNRRKRTLYECQEQRKMLASPVNRVRVDGVEEEEGGEGHALDEVKPA